MTHFDAAVRTLGSLARLNVASAKGFNVAAQNVRNRGLKVMLKSFAQDRAQFAAELGATMEELKAGSSVQGGLSLSRMLGSVHRGWINIKTAMTVGEPSTEHVVLSEVLRGESVARRRYENALKRELPGEVRAVIERQYQEIVGVCERLNELYGSGERRMVVRLFDTQAAAEDARAALNEAGFYDSAIERVPLEEVARVYVGDDANIRRDSTVAGAILGATIVLLLAIAATLSTLFLSGQSLMQTVGLSMPDILVLGLILGAGFGGLFGALIGMGIVEEDAHVYAQSLQRGSVLLLVDAEKERANEAATIMKRVNAQRFAMAG